MTNPTGAVPQDDSTPAAPPVDAAQAAPPVPPAPPAYDASPYVAPAAPAYDASAYTTEPYPQASAPQPPTPPVYAPPSYPGSPYASYPPAANQSAQYPAAGYPVQTTPGAPPVMPYGYGGYAPRKTNGLAVASMILSILGIIWVLPFIGSLIGVIMGHISLGQVKRTGEGGRGMALAGVIVGYVGIAIIVFVVLGFVLLAATSTSYRYSSYGA